MQSRFLSKILGAALCAAAVSSVAQAQFYKLHNTDVGVNATGLFTKDVTSEQSSAYSGNVGNAIPQNFTTLSPGVVFSTRMHPKSWLGLEFNYQYSKFSERYSFQPVNRGVQNVSLPTSFHEATGAYIFHPHFRWFQPYVGVGGGYLDFVPTTALSNQWRGTGLVEAGFDIPTSNPHFGFRVGARSLIYRAPNYDSHQLSSLKWTTTNEPEAGTWIRF